MLRRAIVIPALLTGCDGVLGLVRVSATPDAPIGTSADAAPDALTPDALDGCIPSMFGAPDSLTASGLQGLTLAQNVDGAIVVSNGYLDYLAPVATATPTSTNMAAQQWAHPAMAPTLANGSSLFALNTSNGTIDELTYSGTSGQPPMQWSSPQPATGLGGAGDLPGNPAEVGGGLLMMLQTSAGIEEWSRPAGSAWTMVRAYDSAALGRPAGGSIGFPSLTPDGRVLVYAYSGSAGSGIYYSRRARSSDPFVSTGGGVLAAGTFIAPVLKADCREMWAVDSPDGGLLVHFHQ